MSEMVKFYFLTEYELHNFREQSAKVNILDEFQYFLGDTESRYTEACKRRIVNMVEK